MDGRQPLFEGGTPARTDQTDEDDNGDSSMTFDRRRSELEARSLRRLDLPRVYHENQIAELDAHNCKTGTLRLEVVPRLKDQRGFTVLAKRWIVERTFGWFMKHRRLVRDYETKTEHAEALIHITMIRLMLQRLA
jgi:transposase